MPDVSLGFVFSYSAWSFFRHLSWVYSAPVAAALAMETAAVYMDWWNNYDEWTNFATCLKMGIFRLNYDEWTNFVTCLKMGIFRLTFFCFSFALVFLVAPVFLGNGDNGGGVGDGEGCCIYGLMK
jgi:hypothetical protein